MIASKELKSVGVTQKLANNHQHNACDAYHCPTWINLCTPSGLHSVVVCSRHLQLSWVPFLRDAQITARFNIPTAYQSSAKP